MNQWLDVLLQNDYGSSFISPETMLLALLLAFCIGHVVGWVYMATHVGLSYSQMFVASLVVLPPIVALVMVLMAGDVVIAFGLLAVLAVVRFRNVLKDTRDTTFVLWAITEGVAVGTMRLSSSLVGCLALSLIFLYLWFTSFGERHRYDVIVSLQASGERAVTLLNSILWRHCVRVQLAGQRELMNQMQDVSYRLLLRDPARSGELLAELENAAGIAHVSLFHRDDEKEM